MEKTKIKQEEVKLFLSSLPEQTYENLDPVLIDQNIDSRQQSSASCDACPNLSRLPGNQAS